MQYVSVGYLVSSEPQRVAIVFDFQHTPFDVHGMLGQETLDIIPNDVLSPLHAIVTGDGFEPAQGTETHLTDCRYAFGGPPLLVDPFSSSFREHGLHNCLRSVPKLGKPPRSSETDYQPIVSQPQNGDGIRN